MYSRVLITSGPTYEPIDPVRFIGNRSSGVTGFHIAEAGRHRSGEIVFVSGPVFRYPDHVRLLKVETALEMKIQVFKYFNGADVIIMAAAVSDYRPEIAATEKIKKTADNLHITLKRNPDILREAGQIKHSRQILVGFAAETENLEENAYRKFREKNLDLLVANRISALNPAFGDRENQVFFLSSSGWRKIEKKKKKDIAEEIWREIDKIKETRSKDG